MTTTKAGKTRHTVYRRPTGNLACDVCEAAWKVDPESYWCGNCDDDGGGPMFVSATETHQPVAFCFACTSKSHRTARMGSP